MNKTWLKSVSQHKAERKNAGIDKALTMWNEGESKETILAACDNHDGAFAAGMREQANLLGADPLPDYSPADGGWS